jgi:hypothetical protein
MAATAKLFGLFMKSVLNKEVDIDSDTLKVILLLSSATPSQDTWQYKSSVAGELSTVATTLSSAATAGATTIASVASIPVGNTIVIDSAGTAEVRTVSAVSGTGPYTLTVAALGAAHASGATVVANPGYTAGGITLTGVTVTYDASTNTVKIDCDDPVWASATLTAGKAVFLDSTPATDATRPLISYADFGGDVSSTSGPFTLQIDANGIATLTAA